VSEFEIVFTGVTIILALAIARLLEGLRDVFDRTRRYWIHYLWVVNRLAFAVSFFWMGFSARVRSDHDFVSFLLIAASPVAIFLQANALVTPHPGMITDWKAHFWSIRRWLFGANMVLVLAMSASLIERGAALSVGVYAPITVGCLISVVGYASTSERVHGFLAAVVTLNVAFIMVSVAGLPE
jgi:hypothetical protein